MWQHYLGNLTNPIDKIWKLTSYLPTENIVLLFFVNNFSQLLCPDRKSNSWHCCTRLGPLNCALQTELHGPGKNTVVVAQGRGGGLEISLPGLWPRGLGFDSCNFSGESDNLKYSLGAKEWRTNFTHLKYLVVLFCLLGTIGGAMICVNFFLVLAAD